MHFFIPILMFLGKFICEFTGELLSEKEAKHRPNDYPYHVASMVVFFNDHISILIGQWKCRE